MSGGGMSATEQLIERLAADAAPVRRLRPPMLRAAMWLAPALSLGLLAILLLADTDLMARRMARPELPVELVGTLATGVLGVLAAFEISVPGHSRRWLWLPLPALALWLAGSGAGCWRDWVEQTQEGWRLGHSVACLRFIVGFGVPLTATLIWALRRSRPLAPVRVAAMGGLGAAGLTAFALQFFHPFDVTATDLATHAVAVAAVVACGALAGRATA